MKVFKHKSELLTLAISLGAFSISGFVFFFQFFDVSQELTASVLDLQLEDGQVSVQVAFTNTGNQQALISKMELGIFAEGDSTKFKVIENEIKPDSQAIVCKPGDLHVRTVYFQFDLKATHDVTEPPDADFADHSGARKVEFGLSFLAMDSNGKTFDTLIPFLELHSDGKKILGYTSFYTARDLLENEMTATSKTFHLEN